MRLHAPGRKPRIADQHRGPGAGNWCCFVVRMMGPSVASRHSTGGTSLYTLTYRRCRSELVWILVASRGDPGRQPSRLASAQPDGGSRQYVNPVLPRCVCRPRGPIAAADITRAGRFRPGLGPRPRLKPEIPSTSDRRMCRRSDSQREPQPPRARRPNASPAGQRAVPRLRTIR